MNSNKEETQTALLISRYLAGDDSAAFSLYMMYCKAMYNTCIRLLKNRLEADDILQEAFVSAFQNLKHFRMDASFGSWLKSIVVNQCINHLKKRKLEALTWNDEIEPPPENDYGMEDELDLEVERIKVAIMQLPTGFRTVLSLYLLEGYDHQEIAEILKISESTSKTQYQRAKQKLKELLKTTTYVQRIRKICG